MSSASTRWALVRLSSFGDVVLALAVARAVKAYGGPGAQVTFMTRDRFAPLAAMCPDVDAVHALSDALPLREAARALAGRFDAVVDLQGSLKSWWLTSLLDAPRASRIRKRDLSRRWEVAKATARRWLRPPRAAGAVTEGRPHATGRRHMVDDHLAALAPWGMDPPRLLPRLAPPESDRRAVREELASGPPGPCVGLVPGARWAAKRWPLEAYADLAHKIQQSDPALRFLIFGDEADRADGDRLAADIHGLNLAGRTPLPRLAAWMERCDWILGGDTGPMHLAQALHVPVYVLFGPTAPSFGFFPLGPQDRWLEMELPCRPCSLHGGAACPLGTHLCLRGLTVDAYPRNPT